MTTKRFFMFQSCRWMSFLGVGGGLEGWEARGSAQRNRREPTHHCENAHEHQQYLIWKVYFHQQMLDEHLTDICLSMMLINHSAPAPTLSESMTAQIKGFWQVTVGRNRKKPLSLPVVFRNRTLWALQYKQENCWRLYKVLSKESEMLVTRSSGSHLSPQVTGLFFPSSSS